MKSQIKKFIARDTRGRIFMNIPDKVETSQILQDNGDRYCPPHRWPHSLPITGQLVTDEPCHIHQKAWRQYGHHEPFCQFLKCPHYQAMLQAKSKFKSK
tara:strand:+ start:1400 stop:1696 length:297 start_codon:yes stop_codon:yes gene_type:complete